MTLEKYWTSQATGAAWETAFQQVFGVSLSDFYSDFENYRAREFPPLCSEVPSNATPGPLAVTLVRRAEPGEMFLLEAPFTEAPNVPYIFCVNGVKSIDLLEPVVQLPPGYGWEAPCGGGCFAIYLTPTVPWPRITFSIQLSDGRHADYSFVVRP